MSENQVNDENTNDVLRFSLAQGGKYGKHKHMRKMERYIGLDY